MGIMAGYGIFAHSRSIALSTLWVVDESETEAFASLLLKIGLKTIAKRNRSDTIPYH